MPSDGGEPIGQPDGGHVCFANLVDARSSVRPSTQIAQPSPLPLLSTFHWRMAAGGGGVGADGGGGRGARWRFGGGGGRAHGSSLGGPTSQNS